MDNELNVVTSEVDVNGKLLPIVIGDIKVELNEY